MIDIKEGVKNNIGIQNERNFVKYSKKSLQEKAGLTAREARVYLDFIWDGIDVVEGNTATVIERAEKKIKDSGINVEQILTEIRKEYPIILV